MAESYLGGHSLHKRSWFGRTKEVPEKAFREPEFECELTARALNKRRHHFFRSEEKMLPRQRSGESVSLSSDTYTLKSLVCDYATIQIRLNNSAAGSQARLRANLKRIERRLSADVKKAIADAQRTIGGLTPLTKAKFVRTVLLRASDEAR
jgi:hypothetical protein